METVLEVGDDSVPAQLLANFLIAWLLLVVSGEGACIPCHLLLKARSAALFNLVFNKGFYFLSSH